MDICCTVNSRFVQWVTHLLHWNPPVCAVGDHVLLESKEEQVKERPEPTQQELVVEASQEAGCSNTVDLRVVATEEAVRRIANNLFVSEDQGLLCVDIEVSSPLHGIAWNRIRCGPAQWPRQSSEFAPEIEGRDTVFTNGGTAVARAQPEDPDVCIGRPTAFHPTATTTPPIAPKPAGFPGRASGDRLFSSHHQRMRKTHRNHLKFTLVTDVGM